MIQFSSISKLLLQPFSLGLILCPFPPKLFSLTLKNFRLSSSPLIFVLTRTKLSHQSLKKIQPVDGRSKVHNERRKFFHCLTPRGQCAEDNDETWLFPLIFSKPFLCLAPLQSWYRLKNQNRTTQKRKQKKHAGGKSRSSKSVFDQTLRSSFYCWSCALLSKKWHE